MMTTTAAITTASVTNDFPIICVTGIIVATAAHSEHMQMYLCDVIFELSLLAGYVTLDHAVR